MVSCVVLDAYEVGFEKQSVLKRVPENLAGEPLENDWGAFLEVVPPDPLRTPFFSGFLQKQLESSYTATSKRVLRRRF